MTLNVASEIASSLNLVDVINASIEWAAGLAGLQYGALPDLARTAIGMVVACLILIGYVAGLAVAFGWAERRIAGRIQSRQGPNRVGPQGILQLAADGIKLLIKEDIIPGTAHPLLFRLAPMLVLMGAFAPFVVLPFSENLVVSNMSLGIFYALSFAALEVVGVIMAGWASNSKWSLYGGMRLAAQMMSYEIPMGLAVLSVVVVTGSLHLGQIADEQQGAWILGWNIFRGFPWLFIAAFIFYIAGLASSKRLPFDLPEAESELVAGYHTEYSGMRFVMFMMAEYGTMYVISALTAVLFMGGWHGPLPRMGAGPVMANVIGTINLIGKSFFLMFVMLWLRWTFPRVRIDQIIHICMKALVPAGLVCLVGAAAWGLIPWAELWQRLGAIVR